MSKKVIASNRKAKHNYFLLESFEAGIVLKGSEIKSIRANQISISESYVQTNGKEAWLINAHISPYDPASRQNHEPKRKRKLLLSKREIKKIWQGVQQKGLTVIPLEVYLRGGLAKVSISLAKGKKLYDKRRDIMKKDVQREIDRQYKHRY
jgi:SsrA-binding protein